MYGKYRCACGGCSAGGEVSSEVSERGEWARCGVRAAVRAHCPLPSRIGLNHSGTFLMPHVQQGRPSLRHTGGTQGVEAGVGEAAYMGGEEHGGSGLDEELVILDQAHVELRLVAREAALLLRCAWPRRGCM